MRFNLYWLAVKQVRVGHWLHDKLFTIGLVIHVLRKYHKLNPSIADIYAYQHGEYPKKGLASYMDPTAIRDGKYTLRGQGEPMPLKSRIRYGLTIAKDVVEGKMDHDAALFNQYFGILQAEFDKIKREVK